MKQLVSDSFGDFAEANKKGSRIKAIILGGSDDRIDLQLTEDVKGFLPMKDYTNSMSEAPIEEERKLK